MRSQIKSSLAVMSATLVGITAGLGQAQSQYATEVVAQNDAYGNAALYNDPRAVLGEPTRKAINAAAPPVGTAPYHIKIVEPAYSVDFFNTNNTLFGTNKVITTLSRRSLGGGQFEYGSITVRFDQPVIDDPTNPYGIDLNVFGNAFYIGGGTAGGFVSDTTDMRNYFLAGGIFAEPVIVSVSPDNVNWYTYAPPAGPFGDSAFPTQSYAWDAEQHDATGNGWDQTQPHDFTKPVNPALSTVLGTNDSASPYWRTTTADAIGAYLSSGGGTGFDLAESGFESIQYVRVNSAAAPYLSGEIDAFADVRPARVGEALSIAPQNVTAGINLFFQSQSGETQTAVLAAFTSISTQDLLSLATSELTDLVLLAALPGDLQAAYRLDVSRLLPRRDGVTAFTYTADFGLWPGAAYSGDGSDLQLYAWDGFAWQPQVFVFDPQDNLAYVLDWSQLTGIFALSTPVPSDTTAPTLQTVLSRKSHG